MRPLANAFLAFTLVLSPAAAQSPNVLLILSDDHAAHALSCYGSRINSTPNLDRIAEGGMRFANCFVTNSLCGPSRATILTGKYSHLHGFSRNGDRFDGGQVTFPKLLQAAGYHTAVVGKWHLGTEPTGFDWHVVLPGQGRYHDPDFIEMGRRREYPGYVTDVITDLALDYLRDRRPKDRPFFLMYSHKAPHREWAPDEAHMDMFLDPIPEPETLFDDYATRGTPASEAEMTVARHLSRTDVKGEPPEGLTGRARTRWYYQRYMQDYLRCVASMDDNVGRVLDYLEESGLAEDTLVIYISDQGFFLGDHGWYDKRFMYEEALRTPLLVRWPGVTEPGTVEESMAMNLDLAQSILEAAGVEAPREMQGRSLVPLLRGKQPDDWRESIYYHYYEYPAVHMVHKHVGVRTERYKLIHFYELDQWELYDLQADPDEVNNLYGRPGTEELTAELKAELERLQEHYGDDGTVWDPRLVEAADVEYQPVLRLTFADEALVDGRHALVNGSYEPPDRGLDPSYKPLWTGAWVRAEKGVVVAHGGGAHGFSLWIDDGVPVFAVRSSGTLHEVRAAGPVPADRWTHVAGTLDRDGRLRLYVDGMVAALAEGGLVRAAPAEGLYVGADPRSSVGDYPRGLGLDGAIADVRLGWGPIDASMLREWASR